MKTTKGFTSVLLMFVTLAFLSGSFAQETSPQFVVRIIYFVPNDREPRQNMDIQLVGLIKLAQERFADLMENQGFSRKTFRIETDSTGKVVVHHVRGRFNDAYYQNPASGSWIVWNEIEEQFDTSRNIYLLVLDISSRYLDGTGDDDTGGVAGRGGGDSLSGKALVTASDTIPAIHELYHTFGLHHDLRSDSNFCYAEWLDVHRYFNSHQKAFNQDTNVQMLKPSLASPPDTIRLRFEVTDADGLYQAQLYKPFGNNPSVIACTRLTGNKATVEFLTTQLIGGNWIVLRVMDLHGNFTEHSFQIDVAPLLPPPEVISIPDSNLAAAIRETLGLASGKAITDLAMLRLDLLSVRDRQITDLTGIEHATNIGALTFFGDTQITDITPLAELTKLAVLNIDRSRIGDLSPLAGLTNLRHLNLRSAEISGISPLSGLTNLKNLLLMDNLISDLSPLAELTNLRELSIVTNKVSDISPLVRLPNLKYLHLQGNPLNYVSINTDIPTLRERGVEIAFNPRTPQRIRIVSGNDQQGLPGATLENPFYVEVQDEHGAAFEGVPVTFSVTAGDGTLSTTSTTTDANGRAESTLTLGPNPGTNTVTVSVTGTRAQQTFNAEGIRIPLAFWIISGFDQKGLIGEALPKPIVVEVRDQSGEPLPGVQVTFAVTSGGGTLSVTSTTTDSDGRAESILTLGPNPGPNSVTVSVTGIQEEQTVTAIAEPPPIPQDVNRDDAVNILDLVFVASALGDEGQGLVADVNGDGVVNILDLVMVAGALGNAAAAPSANPRALAMLTATDVGRWLGQAQGLDLMDATSQRGVLLLEQLLAALTPKETALLPNYPNPFNPETWIPYRLAEDSHVTMTIFNSNGMMIRRLDMGHQSARFYESRSKAIHWDGRNEFGEGVASGVYFYHLSAGNFSATRKMLIVK